MQPFLALITPLAATTPPTSDARPTHPIALPGDPWWGGGGPVDPGWSGGIGEEGTRPPIGSVDPGWGQTPGARPSHPIFYPPGTRPPQTPPGFWGGGPHPMPPIAPPGETPPPVGTTPPQSGQPIQLPGQDPSEGGWVYAYVPGYGWTWIQVAEGAEPAPMPPDMGNIGPAHPIQPTVPEPKKN